MDSTVYYIYGLVDPRTSEVRYIGQTKDSPQKRLREHLWHSSRNQLNHKAHWLNELLQLGIKPAVIVLEECDETTWAEAERRWISEYRQRGVNLTNILQGGEIPNAKKWSEDARERLSKAHRGKTLSAEHRETLRRCNTGRVKSERELAKMSAASKGRKRSPEQVERLASQRRGKKASPELRAKLSAARKGIVPPPHVAEGNRIRFRGEGNHQSKLTEEQVYSILRQAGEGVPYKTLAENFHVHHAHISMIVRRRTWKHLQWPKS